MSRNWDDKKQNERVWATFYTFHFFYDGGTSPFQGSKQVAVGNFLVPFDEILTQDGRSCGLEIIIRIITAIRHRKTLCRNPPIPCLDTSNCFVYFFVMSLRPPRRHL